MTLGEKQRLFTSLVGKLIAFADSQGYGLTFGDAYRSPDQARQNAQLGKGIVNSLHCERLAIDLNLFIGGEYKKQTEDYRVLGEFWESLGPDCAWGGRFSRPDGNHFSIRHGGRA